ncbi:hypothetical protein ABZS66_61465 [Dactylosporangium sp. NPDC005572]|uniref:hypothetical protein n=1 Tax=Dactylosporangium sp. NPDC005572 TaxID=3156889 RepID=UPI0033A11C33
MNVAASRLRKLARPPIRLANLIGHAALITGGNSDIGLETARVLLDHSATAILAGRNRRRLNEATNRTARAAPRTLVTGGEDRHGFLAPGGTEVTKVPLDFGRV